MGLRGGGHEGGRARSMCTAATAGKGRHFFSPTPGHRPEACPPAILKCATDPPPVGEYCADDPEGKK
eukprot:scaffold7630_cov122-Isochrysis_galbana.AAC.6